MNTVVNQQKVHKKKEKWLMRGTKVMKKDISKFSETDLTSCGLMKDLKKLASELWKIVYVMMSKSWENFHTKR